MSFTGVSNLDTSIDKTNAWLAEIAGEFGTEDRRLAAVFSSEPQVMPSSGAVGSGYPNRVTPVENRSAATEARSSHRTPP